MTSIPDETAPNPAADDVTRAPEPAPAQGRDDALDEGAYDGVLEPRSAARALPLGDGTWHQLSRKYVCVELITSGAITLVVAAITIVVGIVLDQTWALIGGGAIVLLLIAGMAITPRQARALGYQLRDDDLLFRSGILWQRMVAVPYGRLQLVDISHGPLDRGFGIAKLKLVTAAASTGVTVPGLTQAAAERLRDVLIDVAETRRTGL